MPKEVFGRDHQFLEREELLSFEEIARLATIAVGRGVEKIRITGGEPLVRRELPKLISMLSPIPGLLDLTLTTNGSLLAAQARSLKDAGLRRITVSLDALDDATFQAMNDVEFPVKRVLEGIDAAIEVGLAPIKINVVVKRGLNEHAILEMARRFRSHATILRFIEYMDVGSTNHWRLDEVVPASEIVSTIHSELPLEPIGPLYVGEVAQRYRYKDGSGEIGVISSVTQPFCQACTRARVSSDGSLYTCLFASTGHDLRALLRGPASDIEIGNALDAIWRLRDDRYSELRANAAEGEERVEMSHIGG